jgi:hypothetical protein
MQRTRRVFRVRRPAIQSSNAPLVRSGQVRSADTQYSTVDPGLSESDASMLNLKPADCLNSRSCADHEPSRVRLGYSFSALGLGRPIAHGCVPRAQQQRLIAQQARIEVQLQLVVATGSRTAALPRLSRGGKPGKAAAGEGGARLCRLRACERRDRSVLRNEVDRRNRQTPTDWPFQPVQQVCPNSVRQSVAHKHRMTMTAAAAKTHPGVRSNATAQQFSSGSVQLPRVYPAHEIVAWDSRRCVSAYERFHRLERPPP